MFLRALRLGRNLVVQAAHKPAAAAAVACLGQCGARRRCQKQRVNGFSRRRMACTEVCCKLSSCRATSTHSALLSGVAPRAVQAGAGPLAFVVKDRESKVGGKVRLDTYLAEQLPGISRAKLSASIRAGRVCVNGAPVVKPSAPVRTGDQVTCMLLPPEPSSAVPEALPLDVVYEDDHLLVVNKPAGMVVHISPGHARGTLVNALLAHCGLPAMDVPSGNIGNGGLFKGICVASDGALLFDDQAQLYIAASACGAAEDDACADEDENLEISGNSSLNSPAAVLAGQHQYSPLAAVPGQPCAQGPPGQPHGILRPGIVHRLDKGTTGLMVVAKDDASHAGLCAQFSNRTVSRTYQAICLGVPTVPTVQRAYGATIDHTGLPAEASIRRPNDLAYGGRVATNIARDPGNRLRMCAAPMGSRQGRAAASNWRLLKTLAGGRAALVEWRLETGRTHQIRVHAKHIGYPLLGDDLYGATPAAAMAALTAHGTRESQVAARDIVEAFQRPALHALTLGFTHPITNKKLWFSTELPEDMCSLLGQLQRLHVVVG